MVEGQCGTYLRLTRASSGPRMSIAKTYRDETKTKMKMNILARSQWSSSAVEYKRVSSFSFSFHLYMSQRRTPAGRTMLSSVLGKCRTVPVPYLFVSCLSRFSLLYTTVRYLKAIQLPQSSVQSQQQSSLCNEVFSMLFLENAIYQPRRI